MAQLAHHMRRRMEDDEAFSTEWDSANVAYAIIVSIGAGLATGLGGALVFFPTFFKSIPQNKVLGVSLALSAGVMLYVSFIEIFAKSLDAISNVDGINDGGAAAITTVTSPTPTPTLTRALTPNPNPNPGPNSHPHPHPNPHPHPHPNPNPNNHRLPRLCTLQTASALLRRRCSTSSSEMRRPRYAGPNPHPLTLTPGPLADPRPDTLTPYPKALVTSPHTLSRCAGWWQSSWVKLLRRRSTQRLCASPTAST